MRIALTVTEGRIASLFETARGLRVVTRERGVERVEEFPLPGPTPAERVAQVLSTGADLVVTGGIARMFRWMLEGHGVRVLPWIVGPVDAVVARLSRGRSGARRIAVSASDAKPDAELEPCFGRAPFMGLFDPDLGEWEFLAVGTGVDVAERLASAGLQAVLTGTIGPISAGVLSTAGVDVVTVSGGTLEEVVGAFESGGLDAAGGRGNRKLLASAGVVGRQRSRTRSAPAVRRGRLVEA